MKILAFAGSNSTTSINKKLVAHVASYFSDSEVEIIDLNDFEMPIYQTDVETKQGIPNKAMDFAAKIDQSDLLLVSLAEHNSSYSSAFKNCYDWISRIKNRKALGGKKMFLMATSPGMRGGASVLESAKTRFTIDSANILEVFSLPSFFENYSDDEGVTSSDLKEELLSKIEAIKANFS